MRILVVTSEAVPFAKTGGLADVCGALPRALADLGHDVRVVMPRYGQIDRSDLRALPGPLGVPTGRGELWSLVLESRLPGSAVPVYFLEHDALFDRDGLYGPPGEAYGDNCLRFAFLSRGALQLCHKLAFFPDVIHCHDWQAALATIYLSAVEAGSPLGRAASVLTIHNLGYQGRFAASELAATGLGPGHFHFGELEHFGDLNVLKGGIANATKVTTVSPTYAEEIAHPEHGEGLDAALRARGSDLRGILNGIDEELWNPATDPLLPARYDRTDLRGKAACKKALQQRLGLPTDDEAPLAGFIGRLAEQKGVDLVVEAAPEILAAGAQLVVLGTGAAVHEARLRELGAAHPSASTVIGFDEGLAHQIYAASDLLLMPSRYEPCGLNQLYAMRYGTVPVVTNVGGLRDSVKDPAESGDPTGLKLAAATGEELARVVREAVDLRAREPGTFGAMQRAGMARPSGWTEAARTYEGLFQHAATRGE